MMTSILLRLRFSFIIGIGIIFRASDGLELGHCRAAFGMQTSEIRNESITASSSSDPQFGPASARIRQEINGGAWCPKQLVSKDVYEYLQVDLGDLQVITFIETQGRFGKGQGQEYVEQYKLEYQREDGKRWFKFKNRRGQEIFQGNSNTYIAEMRDIDPPIIARRIRFVPYSLHAKHVCLRIELYGCPWKDGIVSYELPQGERRSIEVELYDATYDGDKKGGILADGMGQLVDGELGQSNFRLDPKGIGIKGYEWIGWKNDSFSSDGFVEIQFKFDAVRNFTTLAINCNNMFSKDVRVFKMARIEFSVTGDVYSSPVEYRYLRDSIIEFARSVEIPLKHSIGRFVRVRLYFDSKWMMVSEVQFESEYAKGSDLPEDQVIASSYPGSAVGIPSSGVDNGRSNKSDLAPSNSEPNDEQDVFFDTSKTEKSMNDEYVGIIIGALVTLILLLGAVAVVIFMRRRRSKYSNNHRVMKCIEPPRHIAVNVNSLHNGNNGVPVNGKVINGNMYNFMAMSDVDSDQTCCGGISSAVEFYKEPHSRGRQLPELPKTPDSSDTYTSREFALPSQSKTALIVNVPPPEGSTVLTSKELEASATLPHISRFQSTLHRKVQPPSNLSILQNGNNFQTLPNIQGISGNSVYAVPDDPEAVWIDDLSSVIEFPRENLKFVEKVGEGQFGEVHLCEAVRLLDFVSSDIMVASFGANSALVAVKMLKRNADDQTRANFDKEVRVMSRLKDQNIVRLLGVCTVDEPYCVIVEYMKYGDLNQFLRCHVIEGTTLNKRGNVSFLSYGALIYMASQIAAGMKFMENLNMVHRDLATRNCLVGDNYLVKISDFGMSRSLYSADYYTVEGKATVPVRWMAWESILLGKFSTKSDVWSFGVTMWEILTFAREQPLASLSNQQVIENFDHYYRSDCKEICPPQPTVCPREIYDLMRECWNRDETLRPAFREIHMFLQRKNMGFNTIDEKVGTYPRQNTVIV